MPYLTVSSHHEYPSPMVDLGTTLAQVSNQVIHVFKAIYEGISSNKKLTAGTAVITWFAKPYLEKLSAREKTKFDALHQKKIEALELVMKLIVEIYNIRKAIKDYENMIEGIRVIIVGENQDDGLKNEKLAKLQRGKDEALSKFNEDFNKKISWFNSFIFEK